MSARRQLWTLFVNAVRLDLRPRVTAGEGRWARIAPLVVHLGFNALTGFVVAYVAVGAGLPLAVAVLLCYAVGGTLVFMHLIAESDQLSAPLDGDILYWRPIAARTLFLARALHISFYVLLLATVQLLLPAAFVAAREAHPVRIFAVILLAGWVHTVWVTAAAIVVHGSILRRLPAERVHTILTVLQLAFAIAVMAGSQLLAPELLRGVAFSPGSGWNWLLPPAWFAAWPTLVHDGAGAGVGARAALGIAITVATVAVAIGRLAPRYEAVMAALREAEGRAARRSWIGRGLDAIAERTGGHRLRQTGFEFLLAQLRGDRRTRESLWTLMGLPLGILVAAIVAGAAADPYASRLPGTDAPVEWSAENGPRMLFTSAYLVAWTMLGLGRTLGRSAHWKGAWVFRAAPVQRYDEFCLGIGAAVAVAIVLPVFLVQAVVLVSTWHHPLHVVMHLLPPMGLALVALAAAPLVGFEPPFTREAARLERGADFVLMLLAMIPISGLAFGHWASRDEPWLVIVGGLALVVVAPLVWRSSRRRIRNCFRDRTFAT